MPSKLCCAFINKKYKRACKKKETKNTKSGLCPLHDKQRDRFILQLNQVKYIRGPCFFESFYFPESRKYILSFGETHKQHVDCLEQDQDKILNITEVFDLINKIYCSKQIRYFIESEFLHQGDASYYSHKFLPQSKEDINVITLRDYFAECLQPYKTNCSHRYAKTIQFHYIDIREHKLFRDSISRASALYKFYDKIRDWNTDLFETHKENLFTLITREDETKRKEIIELGQELIFSLFQNALTLYGKDWFIQNEISMPVDKKKIPNLSDFNTLLFVGLKLKKQIEHIESAEIQKIASQIWQSEIQKHFPSFLSPFYTVSTVLNYSEMLSFNHILMKAISDFLVPLVDFYTFGRVFRSFPKEKKKKGEDIEYNILYQGAAHSKHLAFWFTKYFSTVRLQYQTSSQGFPNKTCLPVDSSIWKVFENNP